MRNITFPIRLTRHALEQCRERGATEDEVREAIHSGEWEKAKQDRIMAKLNIQFGRPWGGIIYPIKQVAVFVVEESEIVVITVYTFYF